MVQKTDFGTARNFFRALLLSFLTFGFYNLFYQFWLYRDLDEHYQLAFKFEPRSYPTLNNPTTLFIFLIIFPLYSYYTKYHLLHEHIATSPIQSSTNCAEGYKALLFFLFFTIPTLGIVPIILEARWQKAFNEHLLAHKRQKSQE
ncbi:MAG: hypothetical protein ACTSXO_04675 [Candidatus Heimdallarchaeota archaeon]